MAWVLLDADRPGHTLAAHRPGGSGDRLPRFVVLLSVAFNIGHVNALGITGEVVKHFTFFLSFVLVMYFVASIVTTRRQVDGILMLMVGGGTVVALLSIIEWRTGYNAFNHLHIPGLRLDPTAASGPPTRGLRTRAYASAQHPIALASALVLLLPLAVYLYRRYRKLAWMGCAAALTLGALATVSRTAAVMLFVELLVFLWVKRAETVRLLPMLLPLFVACQILLPGTLGHVQGSAVSRKRNRRRAEGRRRQRQRASGRSRAGADRSSRVPRSLVRASERGSRATPTS